MSSERGSDRFQCPKNLFGLICGQDSANSHSPKSRVGIIPLTTSRPSLPLLNMERTEETMVYLEHAREQGHTCIELRKDGLRFIYFCLPCMAGCSSLQALRDHLGGKLSNRMITFANVTLAKPNPWPFKDRKTFFPPPPK